MRGLLLKIAARLSGSPHPVLPQAPNTEERAEAPPEARPEPGGFTQDEALL